MIDDGRVLAVVRRRDHWLRACVRHPDNRRMALFADFVDRLRVGGQVVHGRDNEMRRVVDELDIVIFVVRARVVRGRPYRNCC